jgi:hypothetical protein
MTNGYHLSASTRSLSLRPCFSSDIDLSHLARTLFSIGMLTHLMTKIPSSKERDFINLSVSTKYKYKHSHSHSRTGMHDTRHYECTHSLTIKC